MLLRGALDAETKVGMKFNIEEKNLSKVLKKLPALRNPTVSGLSGSGWMAVETIIEESVAREIIPALKATGAEVMLTTCPKCVAHFECLKFEGDPRHDFEILDVVSFLARQVNSR